MTGVQTCALPIYLTVVDVPMILQLLRGPMTGRLGGLVVGFSYLSPKTFAGLAITLL